MPLSKARDKARKQLIRLEKLISPSKGIRPIQPEYIIRPETVMPEHTKCDSVTTFDADGQVIPEYY